MQTAEFEQQAVALNIDDGDIERGEYLVKHVFGCADSTCHKADMGGGILMDNGPRVLSKPDARQRQRGK